MRKTNSEGGYIFLLTLVMSMALFVSLSSVLSLSLVGLSSIKRTVIDDNALYEAEAGVDNAVYQVNQNPNYKGTDATCPISGAGNPVTIFSNSIQGKGTYQNCVMAGSITNELIVYGVGKVYRSVTDASPMTTKTVKAVLEGSQSGGYSVMTGPGGLILTNSATITNGPVSVGGTLTMSGNARIGTSAANTVGVSVANDRCPTVADSTYPTICATGVQPNPISMGGSAHIYGDVTANNQTNALASYLTNGGLKASSGAVAPTLPNPTRWSSPTSNLTGAAASCSGIQKVVWPANVKITGNVTMANSCTITASGNVWITGTLTLNGASILTPANGLATAPFVMIDGYVAGSGSINVNNGTTIATNAGGIGFQFVTYYSTAACSPTCGNVTGTDLKNSQTLTTVSLGNAGLGTGSTFEAMWTEADVANGGTIGGVMAQTIDISGNANISFSSGGVGGSWVYDVRYYEVQ